MKPTAITNEEIPDFLGNTIRSLSELSNEEEINSALNDFMSKNTINTLSENKLVYSIIPNLWFAAYKRVVYDNSAQRFPLNLLWLPVLFKNLDWKIESRSELQNIHDELSQRTKINPSLYNMLNILFIEGLLGSLSNAYFNFDIVSSTLTPTEKKKHDIDNLKIQLHNLGW